MPSLLNEHQQFFDEVAGVPINNGYIYIGTLGLDPTVLANQLTIYSDAALTTAIDNPQRTGADGRAVNKIYVADGGYSIEVQDSATVQKYNNLNNGDIETTSSSVSFLQAGTGAVSTTVQSKLRETVSVKDFGAVGDGVTDDTAAIQAAIDSLTSGGVLYIPRGDYLTTSTIDIDVAEGITIIGDGGITSAFSGIAGSTGVVGAGRHDAPTRITGDFTSGAVIRVWLGGCKIKDLCVDASEARRLSGSSTGYGIHIESTDVLNQATKRFHLDSVRATNQPSHGIVAVNDLVSSRMDMTEADHCRGHGIFISGGDFSSRTNKTRPGQIQLHNCRASRCGGHSLRIGGSESTTNDIPYRVEIINFETFYCCITPTICQEYVSAATDVSNMFISGENHQIMTTAVDGRSEKPTISDTHSCYTLNGENIVLENSRSIDGNPYAVKVAPDTALASVGRAITIRNLFISNNYQSAGFYDPAVFYSTDVQGVKVEKLGASASIITSLSSKTATTNYYEEYGGVITVEATYDFVDGVDSTFQTGSPFSLNDDQAGYIDFGDSAYGMLLLSGNVSGGMSTLVHFRCGDANNHATIVSSSGGTVTGQTGTLAGTTGTDTHVTIAADSATDRLYIENRTGGVKAYLATIVSLTGGGNQDPAAFVTV